MSKRVTVCKLADLPEGKAKLIQVETQFISVFNAEGELFAIDDQCTHRGAPLSEGRLDGKTVICPWHGAKFDLKTGMPAGGPASLKVKTYPVHIQGDAIEIEVP